MPRPRMVIREFRHFPANSGDGGRLVYPRVEVSYQLLNAR